MISVAQYLEAATRPNTERAYAAATRHFEIEWGGHLPTTAEQVARYLAAYVHRIADNHQCFLAVALRDEAGGRHWD